MKKALCCPYGGSLSGAECADAPACQAGGARNPDGSCQAKGLLPPPQCGKGPSLPSVGNPVNLGAADKHQSEVDYGGPKGLAFVRHYHHTKTGPGGRLGMRWRHNFEGAVTAFGAYDPHGRLLSVTNPNGLVTTYAYGLRGRLTAKAVDGNATAFEYDAVGNFRRVTLPTGVFYRYTYDSAHRLTRIDDAGED